MISSFCSAPFCTRVAACLALPLSCLLCGAQDHGRRMVRQATRTRHARSKAPKSRREGGGLRRRGSARPANWMPCSSGCSALRRGSWSWARLPEGGWTRRKFSGRLWQVLLRPHAYAGAFCPPGEETWTGAASTASTGVTPEDARSVFGLRGPHFAISCSTMELSATLNKPEPLRGPEVGGIAPRYPVVGPSRSSALSIYGKGVLAGHLAPRWITQWDRCSLQLWKYEEDWEALD